MSTLAQLVALLLALVVLLLAAGAAYVVHFHPSAFAPLTAAYGAMTLVAVVVALVIGSR